MARDIQLMINLTGRLVWEQEWEQVYVYGLCEEGEDIIFRGCWDDQVDMLEAGVDAVLLGDMVVDSGGRLVMVEGKVVVVIVGVWDAGGELFMSGSIE